MRSLLWLFRGWLIHPWIAFWTTIIALLIWGSVFGQEHAPLYSRWPRALDSVVIATGFLLSAASLLWGIRVSWRKSRRGAVIKVIIPVLCVTLFSIGVNFLNYTRAQTRLRIVNADTRTIAEAVTRYSSFTGRLPPALADLTIAVSNAKGENSGPFLARLPTPPSGWTDYQYEARPDGTFRVMSTAEGRTVRFPAN